MVSAHESASASSPIALSSATHRPSISQSKTDISQSKTDISHPETDISQSKIDISQNLRQYSQCSQAIGSSLCACYGVAPTEYRGAIFHAVLRVNLPPL
jgi:hypothetical protein